MVKALMFPTESEMVFVAMVGTPVKLNTDWSPFDEPTSDVWTYKGWSFFRSELGVTMALRENDENAFGLRPAAPYPFDREPF